MIKKTGEEGGGLRQKRQSAREKDGRRAREFEMGKHFFLYTD